MIRKLLPGSELAAADAGRRSAMFALREYRIYMLKVLVDKLRLKYWMGVWLDRFRPGTTLAAKKASRRVAEDWDGAASHHHQRTGLFQSGQQRPNADVPYPRPRGLMAPRPREEGIRPLVRYIWMGKPM
jgi:hypothetical protein